MQASSVHISQSVQEHGRKLRLWLPGGIWKQGKIRIPHDAKVCSLRLTPVSLVININLPFNNCMGCKVGQASFENTWTSKKGKTQLENYHSRDNMYAEVNLFVYKMKVSMKMFKLLEFDLFNFSKAQDKLNAGC